MNEMIRKRNEQLAKTVIKGLQSRNMSGYYAEDKEAAAQFVPQEYKDLWMCACGEVNHKDEEKCAACGAEYGPQHALFEDEEKLKENLEAYNKAEAEKAEAARIALATVTAWQGSHPDAQVRVIFDVYTEEDHALYQSLF